MFTFADPAGARLLGAGPVGIFGWRTDHQALVHAFVTNLRGPEQAIHFVGGPVVELARV